MKKFLFLTICIILIFAGCGLNNSHLIDKNLSKDRTIVLNFNSSYLSTKLIGPNIDMTPATYDIKGTGPNSASFEELGITSTTITIPDLIIGYWVITVDAKNASGIIIGTGQEIVNVSSQDIIIVTVNITPLSGTGTLSLSVDWTEATQFTGDAEVIGTVEYKTQTGYDIPEAITFSQTGESAACSTMLQSGYYRLSLEVKQTGIDSAYFIESVRIVYDVTTSASIFIKDSPQVGEVDIIIEVDMQNPIDITFNGLQNPLAVGTDMTVIASTNPLAESYQWYLDGLELSGKTNSSITIGNELEQGTYELTLIVALGVILSSESLTFKVTKLFPPVIVEGRELLVDFDRRGEYEPYLIKGIGYQPAPIGSYPQIIDNPAILERDFSLLKEMHCNTIRTWGEVNQTLLDYAQAYGIKVIAGFKPYTDDVEFSNPVNRQSIINQFKTYVTSYKDHPAVLFWAIGNEDNFHYNGNDITDWYTLVNEMAKEAHDIEGDEYHPVAIVNGHIFNVGDASKKADDESMIHLDIWGMNVYIGYSYVNSPFEGRNFFEMYAELSEKPLWIGEYGIDAWDNINGREYQDVQAEWVGNNWDEIEESNICIGSALMAYSDEWWKDGNPNDHDYGGYSTAEWGDLQPDDFANEEWWGIVAIEETSGIDKITPREVYYNLQARWAE